MEADVCLPGHMLQADMGGWTSNSLSTRLPQPLLRWSALWHSVIRPVVHHNLMLRNRVPPPALTPAHQQHCSVLGYLGHACMKSALLWCTGRPVLEMVKDLL